METATTETGNRSDAYSRPAARFDADGNIEIRASAALDCRRGLWYTATGQAPTDPPSDSSLTVMDAGNALEPVVIRAMRRAGWRIDAPDPRNPRYVAVPIGTGLVATGHPDATGLIHLQADGGELVRAPLVDHAAEIRAHLRRDGLRVQQVVRAQ